jgi:hypothetical protein
MHANISERGEGQLLISVLGNLLSASPSFRVRRYQALLSWPDEPKVEHNAISVDQAVNFAWGTFKKRYGLFSAVLLTIFVAWIGLEIVVIAGQRFGILLWALAHLAFLLFFASVEIGFLQVCLGLYDGKEPKYADTFAHWSLGIKFLAGQIFFCW